MYTALGSSNTNTHASETTSATQPAEIKEPVPGRCVRDGGAGDHREEREAAAAGDGDQGGPARWVGDCLGWVRWVGGRRRRFVS